MKILVMVHRDPENPNRGGAEIVVAEFAKALAREGHVVHMLCSKFPKSAAEAAFDGVHVARISPEAVVGPVTQLVYRTKFKGRVDLVLEDISGSVIPYFAPLYVREPLISVLPQNYMPLFRQQFSPLLLPALAALERLIILTHNRSWILVISSAIREMLISKGASPSRIRVFHPGLSRKWLQIGAPLPAHTRERRIVCLGKILRYKCQDHAILAFRKIAAHWPGARLSIVGRVGDRNYFRELVALVKELELSKHVEFLLSTDEDQRITLLRRSRGLLILTPTEGFPLVALEAGACGVPVIGTFGIPEDALQEGVNGFRIAFGDIEAIAERVGLLLSNDSVVDGMAGTAHAFTRQFSWDRAARPLLDLVEHL